MLKQAKSQLKNKLKKYKLHYSYNKGIIAQITLPEFLFYKIEKLDDNRKYILFYSKKSIYYVAQLTK